MTQDEHVRCLRCGRDAPPELDGPPHGDPGPWNYAEWEVTQDEDVICPGCVILEDTLSSDALMEEWSG